MDVCLNDSMQIFMFNHLVMKPESDVSTEGIRERQKNGLSLINYDTNILKTSLFTNCKLVKMTVLKITATKHKKIQINYYKMLLINRKEKDLLVVIKRNNGMLICGKDKRGFQPVI